MKSSALPSAVQLNLIDSAASAATTEDGRVPGPGGVGGGGGREGNGLVGIRPLKLEKMTAWLRDMQAEQRSKLFSAVSGAAAGSSVIPIFSSPYTTYPPQHDFVCLFSVAHQIGYRQAFYARNLRPFCDFPSHNTLIQCLLGHLGHISHCPSLTSSPLHPLVGSTCITSIVS